MTLDEAIHRNECLREELRRNFKTWKEASDYIRAKINKEREREQLASDIKWYDSASSSFWVIALISFFLCWAFEWIFILIPLIVFMISMWFWIYFYIQEQRLLKEYL